jgi:hypothetical protein
VIDLLRRSRELERAIRAPLPTGDATSQASVLSGRLAILRAALEWPDARHLRSQIKARIEVIETRLRDLSITCPQCRKNVPLDELHVLRFEGDALTAACTDCAALLKAEPDFVEVVS